MKKCKITVMRITQYPDLMAQYENPISHACDMEVGQVFIANGWEKPEGFCQSAWDTLSPFVLALSHGAENFYDGWMSIILHFSDKLPFTVKKVWNSLSENSRPVAKTSESWFFAVNLEGVVQTNELLKVLPFPFRKRT